MTATKSSSSLPLILLLVAGLLAIFLCACLIILLGFGLVWSSNRVQFGPQGSPAPTQEIGVQMEQIEQQVIGLRGLQFTVEITRTLISTEQLRSNVTRDFLDDYSPEEARKDALTLSAFGLITPDFDLLDFFLELYSEQIAGYYDNETKEMYVVQGSGFNGPERLTYAHEFNHALQDSTFNIQKGLHYNDDECDDGSERCLGIQALLEGDSTLLELKWFEEYATADDRKQVAEYYNNLESPVYDSAPPFMKQDFVFPYDQGYNFVQSLFDEGGWQAVDQAYASPPSSSEQVLHPELYPAEEPLTVTLPDLLPALGAGWEEIDHGVMGEWYTMLILGYGITESGRIEASQAAEAAAGWGGDAYAVYVHPEDQSLAMALVTAWDTEDDAIEFEDAFRDYATGRFGDAQPDSSTWTGAGGSNRFSRQGSQTIWVLAPDATALQAIWDQISNP